MYAANFDYFRATSVAEAVQLMRDHPGAKLLAGGHSLLPAMKLRVAMPPALVDIGRVPGLSGIEMSGDKLTIGALTSHHAIATSEMVRKHCPILAEAASQIGDQQVRNRGTIGGSLAHADPAADFPTVMVALGATLTATGPGGSRDIPAGEFFTDLLTTTLKPDEVLTSISVPAYGGMAGMGGAYLKHRHPASSYAVVGVAAMVGLQDGKCARVSLAIGGATVNPVRATAAETALMGKSPDDANVAAAAEQVGAVLKNPMSDVYASSDFRAHLAKVMARRALAKAVERAKS